LLITGIKSRPTYDVLAPFKDGAAHLIVGQGSGGSAMARLLSEFQPSDAVEVLYSIESFTGHNHLTDLNPITSRKVQVSHTNEALIRALEVRLERASMGMRLYLAGSESFIGKAMMVAARFNLNHDEVLREHCGSLVRRVWCVHCDSFNENITRRIFECSGCHRSLIVRDHYSRHLAGFMGVQADAEVPGEIPDNGELDS
jgi:hypothetical protein